MRSLKHQAGLSIMGLLSVSILLIFVAYLAMRLVPAYMLNMKVSAGMDAIAEQAEMEKLGAAEIKTRLTDRFDIDFVDLSIVNPRRDLIVIKGDDGLFEMQLNYERVISIAGNASVLLEFENSSYY